MILRACLGAAALMLATPAGVHASFPGQNGKFVFSTYDTELDQLEVCTENPDATGRSCFFGSASDYSGAWSSSGSTLAIQGFDAGNEDVFTVNPDGSARTNVTNDAAADFDAAFPPGSGISFTSFRDGNMEIYTATSGGGFPENITDNPAADSEPSWSSFATLAFTSDRDANENVYSLAGPGLQDLERLTDDPASDSSPDWSPDGSRIAFVSTRDGNPEIYGMAADGTGEVRLTNTPTVKEAEPVWAPDGTKIAFLIEPSCGGFACANEEIWQMDPDGTDRELLIGYEFDDRFVWTGLDWQPLPNETASTSTYVRPKGADPYRAALVPTMQACTSPNRQHGPPLAFGSCAPVQPTSPNLTIGTGAGGLPAKSVGFLKLDVAPGAPGPPHDTDIRINFSLTNVWTAPSPADYTGKLRVRLGMRITDREPAGVGGVPLKSSTSVDLPFEFDVTCSATADGTEGASCVRNTSTLAVMPGWPAEGGRQIWAINSVEVFDGGPDGDTETESDNSRFMTQGVFVP